MMRHSAPAPRYVGRFAPSPTGPLHDGSLLTAVASFLHARQAGGDWLVRIEDIDPPRELPGAAASILRTLESMDLHWDGPVLYQSSRLDAYAAVAASLAERGLAFECSCTRSELRAFAEKRGELTSAYPGTCRQRQHHTRPTALRMRVDARGTPFRDALQGAVDGDVLLGMGDYVIRRRDGLPAYHLAVVVDDAWQGVSTIVRGNDLLESTAAQRHLQQALDLPAPDYFHVPVIVGADGRKLSKQTGALPVDGRDRSESAAQALALLGAPPPDELRGAPPQLLWEWARDHWRIGDLTGVKALRLET
jgi:glutamyl-Q tRNA(Asp) synthetase